MLEEYLSGGGDGGGGVSFDRDDTAFGGPGADDSAAATALQGASMDDLADLPDISDDSDF